MSARRLAAVLAVVLGALLGPLAGLAAAQEDDGAPDVEVSGTDLSEFPTVRLRVSLSAAAAAAASGPDAIEVRENGEPVDAQLTPLEGEPVGVVLAMDTSGSISGALADAKAAATGLLGVLPADAPVSVIGFGQDAYVVSEFTVDRDATRAAIDGLEAEGGTALFDAAGLAAERAAASGAERTAVVLLADGADSESTSDLSAAGEALAAAVDDVFIVSLLTEDTDPEQLEGLAEQAGGRVVSAEDPDALAATYVELGQRIVNQWEVVFTSTTPEPTGTFTVGIEGVDSTGEIEVALPDRPTPAPADEEAAPRELPGVITSTAEPGFLQQDWVLWAGAGLLAVAITVALVLAVPSGSGSLQSGIQRRRDRRRSLASDAATYDDDHNTAERAFESVRDAVTGFATRAVERTESQGRIDAALDRAGLVMRAGEYVALVVAIALVAAVVLYLLLGVVGGALGLLVPILGSGAFLSFKASRRNSAFADQLGDALMIMAGSLRSGFGVGQAIDTVAEEMDDPIGTEFRRAILETRLGRDMEDALDGVARRVQNEDFEWVVDAMRINHQVGGDLAQILDQVAETIRARNRLKRQVAALTAEGRMSALVLGVLPIGMGLILYSSNPDYMDPLFSRTIGWVMLGVAVGLLVAGALWLKKLIDIEY